MPATGPSAQVAAAAEAACAPGSIATPIANRTAAATARTGATVPSADESSASDSGLGEQGLRDLLVELLEAPRRVRAVITPVDGALDVVAVPRADRATRRVEHVPGHTVGGI